MNQHLKSRKYHKHILIYCMKVMAVNLYAQLFCLFMWLFDQLDRSWLIYVESSLFSFEAFGNRQVIYPPDNFNNRIDLHFLNHYGWPPCSFSFHKWCFWSHFYFTLQNTCYLSDVLHIWTSFPYQTSWLHHYLLDPPNFWTDYHFLVHFIYNYCPLTMN